MQKQQIFSFVILVLITLAASYFIMGTADYTPLVDKLTVTNGKEIPQQDDIPTGDITINEETDQYVVQASYPAGAPQEVKEFISKYIETFKGYEYASTTGGVYDLDISTQEYNTEEYTSYVVTYSEYTGGANVNTFVKTFVYKDNALVQLDETFNRGVVTSLVTQDLDIQLGSDIWFKDSFEEFDLLQNFYIEEENIVFTFSQYAVAPGSAGIVTVKLPLEDKLLQTSTNKYTVTSPQKPTAEVNDFFSCVDVTGTILESYPRQCVFGGETFVEQIKDIIDIPGDSIELTVEVGPKKVSCTGVIPQECLVVDGDYFYDSIGGFEYEEGYRYEIKIKRTLRWGTINPDEIPADAGLYAYELLKVISKDLVEHENSCVVAGCSSQLCISKEEAEQGGGISTCEYREEYACYRFSECRVQTDGQCGWTMTPEVQECLVNPPSLE